MKKEFIALPLSGSVIQLKDVPEPAFAEGRLGHGFAVQFGAEADGLYSPIDGVVIAAFPTGHAYIVRRSDGLELLIHTGIDSAKLPEAFEPRVKKYDTVKAGQLLTLIKPQYFKPETAYCPVVFNEPELEVIIEKPGESLPALDKTAVRIIY